MRYYYSKCFFYVHLKIIFLIVQSRFKQEFYSEDSYETTDVSRSYQTWFSLGLDFV